jgi:hypothetical protein
MPCIQYRDCNFKDDRRALIDRANDIIDTYRSQGYTLTLRQLYYQFVSRDLIPNTERSYKNLGSAISDARDAGLIDWEAIEDRGRGVKAWLIDEDEKSVLDMIEYRFAMDFWQRQNCYVEVWVEKDALSSVIERACRKRSVPYMACKGYLSASEAWRAGQRFEDAADMGAERLVMIHLGDHDPSGIDMTRDNADRLQLYSRGADIDVRRIALNMDQVRQYDPPENPAKVTDTRAADYIRKYGHSSWELDALEPSVLEALIEREVSDLIDEEIWDETEAEQRQRREILKSLHDRFDDIKEFLAGAE